jgi:hypothetical protein
MSPLFDSEYVIVIQDKEGRVTSVKGVFVDKDEAQEYRVSRYDLGGQTATATVFPMDAPEGI